MVSILKSSLQLEHRISSGTGIGMLSNPIILTLSAICFPSTKSAVHPSCMAFSFPLSFSAAIRQSGKTGAPDQFEGSIFLLQL